MTTDNDPLAGWNRAYQIGGAVLLFVLPFVHAPPGHSLRESAWDWQKLVIYLLGCFVLLKGSALAGYRKRTCIRCVVVGLLLLVAYYYFYHKLSCSLEQGRLVIGWTLTEAAAALLAKDVNQTCVDLLRSFASDPFRVYWDDGIVLNEIVLTILYVGMVTSLSAAVLCWALRKQRVRTK